MIHDSVFCFYTASAGKELANLRRVQASLNRMNLLLDDILALSAINNPPDEGAPVDLNDVLQQARPGKGAAFHCFFPIDAKE